VPFNPSGPSFAGTVQYRHRWDAAFTAFTEWSRIEITRVWDAAHSMRMRVMNPNGKHTHTFAVGDRIQVFAGLGTQFPHPVFDGYIAPGGGFAPGERADKPSFYVNAVSFLARLTREEVRSGPYVDQVGLTQHPSYNGWEVGAALRDICSGLEATPALVVSGIRGTSDPEIFIDTSNDIADGLYTKKQLVDHYLRLAYVDQVTGSDPRPYHLVEGPDASNAPGVRLIREEDPAQATAARTLAYATDVFGIEPAAQPSQATRCVAASTVDKTVYEVYEDTHAVNMHGRLMMRVDVPTTDRGALLRRAWNEVVKRRRPLIAYKVRVRNAFWAAPGHVVDITGSRQGAEGKSIVTRVEHVLAKDSIMSTLVTRSAVEELT